MVNVKDNYVDQGTENINMLKDSLQLRTVWKVDFGLESGLTYHQLD